MNKKKRLKGSEPPLGTRIKKNIVEGMGRGLVVKKGRSEPIINVIISLYLLYKVTVLGGGGGDHSSGLLHPSMESFYINYERLFLFVVR